MAFLQSDLPPSTAPFSSSLARPATLRSPPRRVRSKWRAHILGVLIAAAPLTLAGYAAARATDSIALGILAADLAFLIAVALWSAVASGVRG